jgi:signal transduction histidine kinase
VQAAVSARWRLLWSYAVPALAVAYAVAAVVVPRRSTAPVTSYAAASVAAHAADLGAGLALIGAGLLAWVEPRTRRLGLLAILAGVAWFGPDWEGWGGGPAAVRSLGAVATLFVLPLLFHLVLAFPLGRLEGRLAQAAVFAVYGVAAIVSVGPALFHDPFLDPHCWRNCSDNVFLAHADQGVAGALGDVWLRSAVAIGLLLVAICARRLLVARAPARRSLWLVLVPGGLLGAAEAAYAVALLRNPFENPDDSVFSSIFFARSLSVTLLALGLAWGVVQARRTRATLSRLAAELGEAPPPGKLREALAAAVGDPTLEVAYWLPGSRRLVDSGGKPTEPPAPGHGRAVTPIVRAGQPVAVVAHDAALLDGRVLEREIGSAASLAVENERLQAEVLAQLEDLRSSRARIVQTGDAERRRLERNLHDGAQQRLLAVSYDLRLARSDADREGDPELSRLLGSAADEVSTAVEELRELAQGIYPAVLSESGLGPALATLADTAPLPVELGEITAERYALAIETGAYVTAVEAIQDAAARDATFVSVAVVRVSDRLVVTAADDGADRDSALVHVADRVGALGGSVEAESTTLRAEIPCG